MNSKHIQVVSLLAVTLVLGARSLSFQSPSSVPQPTQLTQPSRSIPASFPSFSTDRSTSTHISSGLNTSSSDSNFEQGSVNNSDFDRYGELDAGPSAPADAADPVGFNNAFQSAPGLASAEDGGAAPQDSSSDSIQSSYWTNQQVQEDALRHFDNHILDQTDVRNAETGETYAVQSGSSSYWTDPNVSAAAGVDTVIGSSDSTAPTATATPLEEY